MFEMNSSGGDGLALRNPEETLELLKSIVQQRSNPPNPRWGSVSG